MLSRILSANINQIFARLQYSKNVISQYSTLSSGTQCTLFRKCILSRDSLTSPKYVPVILDSKILNILDTLLCQPSIPPWTRAHHEQPPLSTNIQPTQKDSESYRELNTHKIPFLFLSFSFSIGLVKPPLPVSPKKPSLELVARSALLLLPCFGSKIYKKVCYNQHYHWPLSYISKRCCCLSLSDL